MGILVRQVRVRLSRSARAQSKNQKVKRVRDGTDKNLYLETLIKNILSELLQKVYDFRCAIFFLVLHLIPVLKIKIFLIKHV